MTSQIESSIDKIDCMTYIDPIDLYRLHVRPIGQEEEYVAVQGRDGCWHREPVTKEMKFDRELRDITSSLNRLRNYIESVDRLHNREIDILFRLVEERTLILSDIDEIYNDYC